MTYKEFLAWLEGFTDALDFDDISGDDMQLIINKARSVNDKDNLAELLTNLPTKIKQILHD